MNNLQYHTYANKMHDLISTKKLVFLDLSTDDLYQKIMQKLFF